MTSSKKLSVHEADLDTTFSKNESKYERTVKDIPSQEVSQMSQYEVNKQQSDINSETLEIYTCVLDEMCDGDFLNSVIMSHSNMTTKTDDYVHMDSDDTGYVLTDIVSESSNKVSDLSPKARNIPETVQTLLKEEFPFCNENQEDSFLSESALSQTLVSETADVFAFPGVEDPSKNIITRNSVVKMKLRSNIEKKYDNKPLPTVDFTPKPPSELTDEEKAKIEKRKENNKESAKRSRMNQAKKQEKLTQIINSLEEENKNLTEEISELKERKNKLLEITKTIIKKDKSKIKHKAG